MFNFLKNLKKNPNDQSALLKIQELAGIDDKDNFLVNLKETYQSDEGGKKNIGLYIAKHCSQSVVQAFLKMLETKFSALGFSAQDKLEFFKLQTENGWTLGMFIAQNQDAATTQQFLKIVTDILSDETISTQDKLEFLKLQDNQGWTLGMFIDCYQDAVTTQQYLNLVREILVDESISAQDKHKFLKLQINYGWKTGMVLARKNEARAIFWRMAIPYYQNRELSRISNSTASQLAKMYLKDLSKDSLTADDYISLGRLVSLVKLNYKSVRAALKQKHLSDPPSVAAECYNRALKMNPKSDANYYLAEQLLSSNVASELYTTQSFYGENASELNLDVTERALCLLDRVPEESLLYESARKKINSLIDGNKDYPTWGRISHLFAKKQEVSRITRILELALQGKCYTAKCLIDCIPENSSDYEQAQLIKAVLIHRGSIHVLDDSNNAVYKVNHSDTINKVRIIIDTAGESNTKYLAQCFLAVILHEAKIDGIADSINENTIPISVDEQVMDLLLTIPEEFKTAYEVAKNLLQQWGYEQELDSCNVPDDSLYTPIFAVDSKKSSFGKYDDVDELENSENSLNTDLKSIKL